LLPPFFIWAATISGDQKMNPIIIRRKHLKEIVGFSPSTVDRLEKQGLFPKRKKFGAGVVGWIYDDVQEAVKNLAHN
jgi:predicted DNA-binding transcriptional regulator AlpA